MEQLEMVLKKEARGIDFKKQKRNSLSIHHRLNVSVQENQYGAQIPLIGD